MDEAPLWYDLEELVCNPRLIEPPPTVIPRLAWSERITLLSAREKAGKSTLAGCAAAAAVRGDTFLGEPVTAGRVAWLALDEALGDTVRRFHDLGLTGGVSVAVERPTVEEIHPLLLGTDCRLLVIDTLNAYATGLVDDVYRPERWHPLFQDLRRAIHGTGAGVLVLHHLKKNAPEFAGSQAIGAGADVLLGLTPDEADPTVRRVSFKGRVHGEDYAIRFDPVRFSYTLNRGAPSLDAQLLAAVMREPGQSSVALAKSVKARKSDATAALQRLAADGIIEDRGGRNGGHGWYPTDRRGNTTGTGGRQLAGTGGNGWGTGGNTSGTAAVRVAVPAPIEIGGREQVHPDRPELVGGA